jgi:hypothetical protein
MWKQKTRVGRFEKVVVWQKRRLFKVAGKEGVVVKEISTIIKKYFALEK